LPSTSSEAQTMTNVDELLTAEEVAERLKVRTSTILSWYRGRRIPGLKLSRKVLRFDLGSVLRALRVHRDSCTCAVSGTASRGEAVR
jgi:excisionase family DNA binding protein